MLGGASALRSSVIITGAPFAIVCVVSFVLFMRQLSDDHGRVLFDGDRSWFRNPKEIGSNSPVDDVAAGAQDDD